MFMSLPRLLMLPIGFPLQLIFVCMKLLGQAGEWMDDTMMKWVRQIEHNSGWVQTDKGWVHLTDEEYRIKFKRNRDKW